MQTFDLKTFLFRSGTEWETTKLYKVLSILPELDTEGPWIAGGAVRKTIAGEEPDTDFDFFFKDEDQLKNFANQLEERGATCIKETEHHKTYLYSGEDSKPYAIQLIHFKYYQNAGEVIDSFDYSICQFAFDGTTLTAADCALWDLARKRLVVNRVTYPVSSLRRLLKYQRQGFFACSGCLTTLLKETIEKPELHAQLDIAYVD